MIVNNDICLGGNLMLVYNSFTNEVVHSKVRIPDNNEIAWIRLLNPSEDELNSVLGDSFHVHPLLIEDCIELNHRPKIDRHANQAFVSFYALHPQKMSLTNFILIVGPNYVISIFQDQISFFEDLYHEFETIPGRMDSSGEIAYRILDRTVDRYDVLVDHIEDKIDSFEQNIYENPLVRIAPDVFDLKRNIHEWRRIFSEQKTLLGTMNHQSVSFMNLESDLYFSNIYDHMSRVMDSIDIYRESLTGILELQASMKSDRMNEIMKTLTVISTFFLPLTFIVGVYGMNFKYMPELDWQFGYGGIWLIMLTLVAGMGYYFRKRKWW